MSHRLVRNALCVALLAAFALPAVAAAPPAPYRLRTDRDVVHVEPTMHAPAWQLRVMGPSGRFGEDTLLDGEALRIEPKLLGYARWLDGNYTFELVPVLGDRQRGNSAVANAPKLPSANDMRSSGTFSVKDGVVILAGGVEPEYSSSKASAPGPIGPADVVTSDDAIIQGSLCAGFDCVNGENFLADTLRLKENNLRIHFDDTSATGAFAANDWRLVANDQTNGGASYFGIEDVTAARFPFKVTAGAPNNAMFLSSTGNLGLGTATPVLDVQMSTTDTPAVRFEQTSAGGYTAQTWDVAGNEANFFVRDVTGGSLLPLRIGPGAPTNSIYIAATGNVGMGTSLPQTALHVERVTGAVGVRLKRTGGAIPSAITGWDMINNVDTGRLTFSDDATGVRVPVKFGRNAVDNLLRVGVLATSTVDVNGNLKVTGNIQVLGTVGPDYVFAPGYALPTIADHATHMMRDRHLPKVGPARVENGQGVIDLGAISHGMLEELEVAHLYIAQLDGTVRELQETLGEREAQMQSELAARDAQLAQMRAEIEAIKATVAAD